VLRTIVPRHRVADGGVGPGFRAFLGEPVGARISMNKGIRDASGREAEQQDAEKGGKAAERPDVPGMNHATSSFG
jgi:hypothetical protein